MKLLQTHPAGSWIFKQKAAKGRSLRQEPLHLSTRDLQSPSALLQVQRRREPWQLWARRG